MKIPFTDLISQYEDISQGAEVALRKLMKRGDFILGRDVETFEKSFAEFVGAPYSVGVNSGTDALFFGLLSLSVGPGDEVLVPDYTYIASAYAVSYTGAKPVFVDIDSKTYCLDPKKIERAITSKTKAIMPVHLYGQSVDMDALKNIAQKHNLRIIEDAAQAHGTEYKGKKVGALGDVGAFSFYPTKNLGALGDAGMIVTNNATLYEKIKKLRDYGRKSRYEHASLGYNSRLDSVQAVFLNQKLKHLGTWNKQRVKCANLYRKLLSGVEGILLPDSAGYGKHVYHIFAVRLKNRDRVLEGLRKAGIGAMVHYPVPLHLQEVYHNLNYAQGDFPVAEQICQEILCLPIYPHISQRQVEFVAHTLERLITYG